MARFRGTTEERGYGTAHRAERERRLALWLPGQPCARCGEPMYGPRDQIDLGHDHVNGGYSGLEHHDCNRSEGASRGNRAREVLPAVASGWDVLCKVCRQPYHYAAKRCEVCDVHFHPSGGAVRTCSRTCGVELRRRIYGTRGKRFTSICSCGQPKDSKAARCEKCRVTAAAEVAALREQAAEQRRQALPGPCQRVDYYTCRYCGELGVAKATGQPREVCPARRCQLLRLQANNLRVRKGMTREQADAAVVAYRAEGDHRGRQSSHRWQARRRPPSRTVTTPHQGTLW